MSITEPYVRAFGDLMEEKLSVNRHKGDREGWLKMKRSALLKRLLEECAELQTAVMDRESPSEIAHEAADVANFAMMVADVCGGLKVTIPRANDR